MPRQHAALALASALSLGAALPLSAQPVVTATTSVALDVDTLTAVTDFIAIGATDTSTPVPGFDVGFPISPATDFDLGTLTGEIVHTGRVDLDTGSTVVSLGDFDIGFDESRVVGGVTSGFFIEDNVTLAGVAFDIAAGAVIDVVSLTPELSVLSITDADLLVSPELAGALASLDLLADGVVADDVTFADVGDARVDAFVVVPEPATAALASLGLLALAGRRRR